jgi:hypothetical protein
MRYNNRNDMYEAFRRFLRPEYKEPRYPDYEPAPWQQAKQDAAGQRFAFLKKRLSKEPSDLQQ